MPAKNISELARKRRRKGAGQFAALAKISEERGIICDTTLTFRLPSDLKEKLRKRENWQDELRQILLNLVESDTQHSLS